MNVIVSGATRRAFQESYVNYSVLREISNDFDDAGVDRKDIPEDDRIMGERRTLVQKYYNSVDWASPSQVRKVLDAFETHLLRLQSRGQSEEFRKLITFLERDKVKYKDGNIEFASQEIVLDDLVDQNLSVDISQLRININRIRDAVDEDPALAIGSSKELVEATCKAILTERGIKYSETAEIPELVHLVTEELELVATNVSEFKRGAKSIRRILGSLSNIIQGLAELRNLYGSGHGRSPDLSGLYARHARLCAGAASTLSLFLMETAKYKQKY